MSRSRGAINGSAVQNMRGTIFGSGVTNTSIMEPSPLRRAELGLTPQWQEPPNEAERKLTYIWQQVLGRDKLGASDDFFELGGDSLAATVLAAEIEATFGVQFSPADIINFSTVAKQAQAIAQTDSFSTARLPSHCILGRAGGSQPPVFVVHGAWGFSFFKRAFIDEVGHDRPVYLFQAPGLDGRTSPLASVEEIASLYAATMQAIQPSGPYNIVAMCAGSFIALEMCNVLERAKLKVARLVLIDPHPEPDNPHVPRSSGGTRSRISVRLKAAIKSFVQRSLNVSSKHKRRKFKRQKPDRFQENIRMRRAINADWIEDDVDVPQTMLQTVRQLRRALKKCAPQPFPGKAAMLFTSERQYQILGDGSFWRRHLEGIEYQVCDWDHRAMFSLHLVETARFVRNALEVPFDPRLMPGALIGRI